MSEPLQLLVAEDQEADFMLIERHFRQRGLLARCTLVGTHPQLSAMLALQHCDAVLLDYHVPGLDFEAALDEIKSHSPDLPVLLVTGSIGEEAIVDLLKSGIDDFIHKDRLERLVPALERCLSERAERVARREIEQALNESQEDLMRAQSVGHIGSWRLDSERRRINGSRENHRIFGMSGATSISYSEFLAIVHPDDRALLRRGWKAAVAGAPFDVEHRIIVGDTVRWVRERAELELSADGKLLSAFGTTQEITDRKQDELQLRVRGAALEAAANAIFISDASGTILWVNAAFCAMTGYTREEVIGQKPNALLKSGKHDAAFYRDMWQTIKSGRVWRRELINRRKNGDRYHEEMTIAPVLDDVGQVQHFIAIKQDVSARHEADAVLAHYHNRLEVARREAVKLARVKSDFLANMSHEIRTPLNGVLGLAQAGMRDSRGSKAGDTFARIIDAGQLLLGVINDVLDFSKIEAGKLAIEREPVDLSLLVQRVASMVSDRAREKSLHFPVEYAPALPAGFFGDALRISQVLINLLSNAIKFTAHGAVSLTVSSDAGRLRFSVADSGIGIPHDQIERLFDAFEQQDAATTRRFGGTGLGLAISRQLARLMGGDIEVRSTLGEGSRFILNLPLVEALPPARQDAETSVAGPRLAGVRILAAEDNAINRLVLSELLEPEGVCLTLAENGRLAVEAVGREGQAAFDLVLMDIQMPEMDGYAATRALRKLAPELPIIGLTAHALAEEREKTCAAGMVDHVTKPVQLDELVRAIHRALSAAVRTAASPECRSATAMLSNEGSVADNTLGPPDESEKIASIGLNWPALIYRYNGKIQFIERLLQRAVADYREMPDRLRAIAERGDWPQGAFLAHNIKSIAGNLDADALAILATDTENALREGRADGGPRLGELADAFATMLDVIDRHLAASDSGDAAAINQKKFSGQYGKIVLSPEACQASRQST